MRLKIDENLGRSVQEVFRRAGHDIATVYDQDLAGASDAEVFDACVAERRVLVTGPARAASGSTGTMSSQVAGPVVTTAN